ncbi:hypothetical protein HYW44_04360 [Candidatus Daviesbacteria bacterium]|nr:hypothetical protein [Candidatus Daviesbacteria bacterium]
MRNRKPFKKLKIILLSFIAIAFLLILGVSGFEVVKRAKISNFQVKMNNLTCMDQPQIIKFLKESDIHYFSYKQERLAKDLKKKFFCIGKINTKLEYPDKLWLEAWGREAVFAVREIQTSFQINPAVNLEEDLQGATQSTKEAVVFNNLNLILDDLKQSSESAVFLADREGVIFEQISGSVNFPLLSILGLKLEIGKEIPDGVIEKALFIISRLREIQTPSDNIIIIGDKLVLNSKPRIVFSLKKSLDYQTASLQLILAQAKMNPDPDKTGKSDIESVDLRFNKPVVVYGKNNK